MHWTHLLEKRYFPANAIVIEDVSCAQCGYNLRGLFARGRCPECGKEVGDSLYLLTKPQVVSSSFTALGSSYLVFLLLPAILVIPSPGLAWLFLLVQIAGCSVRVWSAYMLRFRAGLAMLPAIGNHATLLVALTVAEALTVLAIAAVAYMSIRSPFSPWAAFVPAIATLWWVTTLATAFEGTLLASRLGTLLGFDLIRRDALWQRIFLGVLVAFSIVFYILIVAGSPDVAVALVVCFAVVPGLLALVFTMLCLWHTGNAAAQAGDLREDAVDTELESEVDRRPPQLPRQLPDIKVD